MSRIVPQADENINEAFERNAAIVGLKRLGRPRTSHRTNVPGLASGRDLSPPSAYPRGNAKSQIRSSAPVSSGSARQTSRHDSLLRGRAVASGEGATAS